MVFSALTALSERSDEANSYINVDDVVKQVTSYAHYALTFCLRPAAL